MIQIISGVKGSGKTKRLLDQTNDALKVEHGDIVFIDDDKRYMYGPAPRDTLRGRERLSHRPRLLAGRISGLYQRHAGR